MNGKARREPKQGLAAKLPAVGMAGLVIGALLMLAGLAFLALGMMSPADQDAGRAVAQQDAAAMAGVIADIKRELRHDSVVAAARRVPEDAPEQTESVSAALVERGLTDLVDVRVFPPRVEDIEVGSYPDPDFAAVQMLVEARRRDAANARVRHEGTANEHLAFTTAVYDEADEVAAIMLVRVPVERVAREMTSPEQDAWVRLVQGSRVVRSRPADLSADVSPAGRQIVDGSALFVEWGVPPAQRALSPEQSGMLIVVGLIFAILGFVIRSGKVAKMLEPPAPARSPVAPPAAAPPADKPSPPPPPVAATPPESSEPKPDLPDWLLDEGGGPKDLPFGDSEKPAGRKPAETAKPDRPDEQESLSDEPPAEKVPAAPSDGGLELDVPDLDEILSQIDEAGETEAVPEPPAEEGSTSDDPGFDLPENEDGLDFLSDPDESGPVSEETLPEPAAEEELSLLDVSTAMDDESESDRKPELPDEAPEEDEGLTPALEPEATADLPDQAPDDLLEMEPLAPTDSETDAGPAAEPEPEPEPERDEPNEKDRLLAAVESSDLFSPTLFKTDRIRGVVDDTLDAQRVTELGRAIGTMAIGQGYKTVAVGRDGRVSGPLLMSAVIRGLRNAGIDVIEAGSVPAPALWYAAIEMADGCGVMVSASHHGPSENGLQVMLGGRMLGREQLLQVAGIAISGQFAEGDGGYVQENAARAYATALADTVELKRPLKVVVDCGNGIAGNIVPALFESLEIDLIPLYCDVDGSFPNHRADPTDPECLEDLRLCVRNFRADLGIAFDGDGDCLALVADDSEVVGADQVLMLLAQAMLANEPGAAVVMDMRCSARLGQVVEEAGGRAVFAPAGSVPVARAMVDEDAVLGGGMDGQIIVSRRWYPFGDAICAAVRLLELFTDGRHSVRERLNELPEARTTGVLPVAIDARSGHRVLERLLAETDFGDAQVTTIDGVRVDYPDRWGLMRVSVDDDKVELRFGGHDPAALTRIKTDFRNWLLAVDADFPLPY